VESPVLDLNRDHYMIVGVVLLLVGVQFRYVDTYVLNEKASEFIAARQSDEQGLVAQQTFAWFPASTTTRLRDWRPPSWLGWAGISIGAVLILHSLALKKPEGA
jgi:hypothetical protein